jgi:hypothetical protein
MKTIGAKNALILLFCSISLVAFSQTVLTGYKCKLMTTDQYGCPPPTFAANCRGKECHTVVWLGEPKICVSEPNNTCTLIPNTTPISYHDFTLTCEFRATGGDPYGTGSTCSCPLIPPADAPYFDGQAWFHCNL